jgi:hypothetical protein
MQPAHSMRRTTTWVLRPGFSGVEGTHIYESPPRSPCDVRPVIVGLEGWGGLPAASFSIDTTIELQTQEQIQNQARTYGGFSLIPRSPIFMRDDNKFTPAIPASCRPTAFSLGFGFLNI